MKSAKKEKDVTKIVENSTQELLDLMGSNAKIEVSKDDANDAVRVKLITEEERGLLIGNHGETLSSIQIALGMLLKHKTGEWKRIIVDIGDWREKQEDYLKNIAKQTAERVKESGKPESLYNLNPSQRRIIHLELGSIKGIKTESEGEGEERYLIVKPSKEKNK
jgi:spoIIIJ-associated protein